MGCAPSHDKVAEQPDAPGTPALAPAALLQPARGRAALGSDAGEWSQADGEVAPRNESATTRDVLSLVQEHGLHLGPLLGSGITGRVYAGTWRGQDVAIKVMTHGWNTAARMARELQLSTRMHHPAVVRSFLHFTVDTKTQALVPLEQLLASIPPTPAPDEPGLDSAAPAFVPMFSSVTSRPAAPAAAGPRHTYPGDCRPASLDGGAAVQRQQPLLSHLSLPLDAEAASFVLGGACGEGGEGDGEAGLARDDPFVNAPPRDSGGGLFGPNMTLVSDVCAQEAEGLQSVIVQERCDAGSLATALARSRFRRPSGHVDMRLVLLRGRDVAVGLQYLHSMGICHGDLKGENVLLRSCPSDPAGVTAVLADFGLSVVLTEGKSHRMTRSLGTVAYMAPEMLLRGELTPCNDIYSYGMLLFELLACEPPFQGMMAGEVVQQVVMNNARPPFPEHTPVAYSLLATDCWQRERSKRPSAAQVVARLDEMLAQSQLLQLELQQQAAGLTGYL